MLGRVLSVVAVLVVCTQGVAADREAYNRAVAECDGQALGDLNDCQLSAPNPRDIGGSFAYANRCVQERMDRCKQDAAEMYLGAQPRSRRHRTVCHKEFAYGQEQLVCEDD